MDTPMTWGHLYATKQQRKYPADDTYIEYKDDNGEGFIDSLFNLNLFSLEPPLEITNVELRSLLEQAKINRTDTPGQISHDQDVIYLDDRRHDLESAAQGRLDHTEKHHGSLGVHKLLNTKEFFDFVQSRKRYEEDTNSQKRTIYIASPSADAFLTLLTTTPQRSTHLMTDFLQHHIVSRASIHITCSEAQFAMSFHLPYFALRTGKRKRDDRRVLNQAIRKSIILPLTRNAAGAKLYYYEAKTSFLVYGFDDHLWTSCCLVDTYFGSENNRSEYFEAFDEPGVNPASVGIDPASGRSFKFPLWNPRDCFLAVLATRLDQATQEMGRVIETFDRYMRSYEGNYSCFDTHDLIQTQDLEPAVDRIHQLKFSVNNIISAWTKFSSTLLHWFNVQKDDNPLLNDAISRSLTKINKSIADLCNLQDLLEQRASQFKGRHTRGMTASLLQQILIATRLQDIASQTGHSMRLLAGTTFFFLPLSLVVSIFSMNMVPAHTSSAYPVAVLVFVALVSHRLAMKPNILRRLFPLRDG